MHEPQCNCVRLSVCQPRCLSPSVTTALRRFLKVVPERGPYHSSALRPHRLWNVCIAWTNELSEEVAPSKKNPLVEYPNNLRLNWKQWMRCEKARPRVKLRRFTCCSCVCDVPIDRMTEKPGKVLWNNCEWGARTLNYTCTWKCQRSADSDFSWQYSEMWSTKLMCKIWCLIGRMVSSCSRRKMRFTNETGSWPLTLGTNWCHVTVLAQENENLIVFFCFFFNVLYWTNRQAGVNYKSLFIHILYLYVTSYQQTLSKELEQAKRQLDEFRNDYESLLGDDRAHDKAFRREFGDLSVPLIDQLYKHFRKRPRYLDSLTQIYFNDLDYSVRVWLTALFFVTSLEITSRSMLHGARTKVVRQLMQWRLLHVSTY